MKNQKVENITTTPAKTNDQKLQYHMRLPYPIEIVEDDGSVVASIPDLPGCNAFGENLDEALRSLNETKELWLRGKIDSNQPIPEPSSAEGYSGKFVLRIPKSLHRLLDREARKQNVSLNQYVSYLLADRHHLAALQGGIERLARRGPETPTPRRPARAARVSPRRAKTSSR